MIVEGDVLHTVHRENTILCHVKELKICNDFILKTLPEFDPCSNSMNLYHEKFEDFKGDIKFEI